MVSPTKRDAKVDAAFEAAAAAAAATAAVTTRSDDVLSAICATLTAPGSAAVDRCTAAHRLNEVFAACETHEMASRLAARLCTPAVCKALVALLVAGESLVELSLQLMSSLAVNPEGALALERAGLMPVLVAALRADEPLLRSQGLALLASLAELPELAQPLVRAGLAKLVCFLAKGASAAGAEEAASRWAWLADISNSMLATPLALPPAQRRQLLKALKPAAGSGGELRLEPSTARGLARAVGTLTALENAGTPAAASGGGGGRKAAVASGNGAPVLQRPSQRREAW